MPRSGSAQIRFCAFLFLPLSLTLVGCGDGQSTNEFSAGGTLAGGSSPRLIALDGAEYLLKSPASARCNDRCEGMQPLGDIDKDGYADVIVALNRKRSSAPAEHTWIEAYSGRDGSRLWSLQGHYNRDPQKHFKLGSIAVLDDLDGDKVPDVYCREAYHKRSVLLISGSSGKIIGRYPIERKPEFSLPMRCQEYNGDGVADLFFSRSNMSSLKVVVLSGKDFSKLAELNNLWPEASRTHVEWVLPLYHDENSDGIRDSLVRRLLPREANSSQSFYEYAILDGKSFAVLRKFTSVRPRVTAKTFFAGVDDLDGDRIGDFVFSSAAGGGPEGRQTLLQAVSGADGTYIWNVAGSEVGDGAEVWSVDARTASKKSLGPDAGFGCPVVIVPDQNGDQVDDIAALANSASAGGYRPAVVIVSGRTGDIISTHSREDEKGRLMHNAQMVRLPKNATDNLTPIVVSARSPDGRAALAIINRKPSSM